VANVAFKGGDKLEAALKELAKNTATAKELKVGFFEDSRYPDGEFVAQVAFNNEYGREADPDGFYIRKGVIVPDQGNPLRPFFRHALALGKSGYAAILTKAMVNNKFNAKKSLGALGDAIRNQIMISIVEWQDPPNSALTIALKGFDDPLVDSSHMLKSVKARVK
jgi:hypothetical protein